MPRLFQRSLTLALVLAVLLGGTVGCTIQPGQQSSKLTYKLPTVLTVGLGEALPGTDLVYSEHSEDGAVFLVGGQRALKRQGDSLTWEGEPVAGAKVKLDLRVAWYNEQSVHLAGTAHVTVNGANPQALPPATESPIKYSGAVAYSLAKGALIPGTLLSFVGQHEQGAELGGLPENDYPYRHAGDSILWEGHLRDDVHIKLELRVIQYSERTLRVGGLVTLWLGGA